MSIEKLKAKLYQLQTDARNTPVGKERLAKQHSLLLGRFYEIKQQLERENPGKDVTHLTVKLLTERMLFAEVEAQMRERVIVHFIALLAESLGEAKLNELVRKVNSISLDDVLPDDSPRIRLPRKGEQFGQSEE